MGTHGLPRAPIFGFVRGQKAPFEGSDSLNTIHQTGPSYTDSTIVFPPSRSACTIVNPVGSTRVYDEAIEASQEAVGLQLPHLGGLLPTPTTVGKDCSRFRNTFYYWRSGVLCLQGPPNEESQTCRSSGHSSLRLLGDVQEPKT